MKDPARTNQKLIEENAFLKQRIRELELSEPDRKRAEDELRESEEKYRVLFEGIKDAVFVHDLDEEGQPGRFLQVNDVACRRLGYTREELLSLWILRRPTPYMPGHVPADPPVSSPHFGSSDGQDRYTH